MNTIGTINFTYIRETKAISSIEDFTQALGEIRRGLGMTQGDVARQLGVVREMVSRYENGTVSPPLSTIIRLMEIYGYRVTLSEADGSIKRPLREGLR
jgi:transcriptional regulator with XRE-family HTH domain